MKKTALILVLGLYSFSALAALPPVCEQYFADLDSFVANLPKDLNNSGELATLKADMAEGKAQLANADDPVQQKQACEEGIDVLKQLSAVMASLPQK